MSNNETFPPKPSYHLIERIDSPRAPPSFDTLTKAADLHDRVVVKNQPAEQETHKDIIRPRIRDLSHGPPGRKTVQRMIEVSLKAKVVGCRQQLPSLREGGVVDILPRTIPLFCHSGQTT